jgi:TPR repeat protein
MDFSLFVRNCPVTHLILFSWLSKAAEKGDENALTKLGDWLYYGDEGHEKDIAQSFKWFEKAAKMGSKRCQYRLAMMLLHGDGVDENPDAAVEWFQKSADKGYADSTVTSNSESIVLLTTL